MISYCLGFCLTVSVEVIIFPLFCCDWQALKDLKAKAQKGALGGSGLKKSGGKK